MAATQGPSSSVALCIALLLIVASASADIIRSNVGPKFTGGALPNVPVRSDSSPVAAAAAPYTPKGIKFYGGRTLSAGVNVYVIFYGNWGPKSKALVRTFIRSLGPKNAASAESVRNWWRITGLYYNSLGKYLSTNITLVKDAIDNYSYGSVGLSTDTITSIVYNQLDLKRLPYDTKGIYLVLTSQDVSVSGFCTLGCGYHDFFGITSQSILYKVAFVGNPLRCPKFCVANSAISPNGNIAVDAMISTIATELAVTANDPEFTAWLDSKAQESMDKCAGSHGKTYVNSKGKVYNVLGYNKTQFLIPQNWNPKTGKCVKQA